MVYALRDIHGRKYPLGMKLQIGSDPSNQIVLLDPQATPVHATLWEQQGSCSYRMTPRAALLLSTRCLFRER